MVDRPLTLDIMRNMLKLVDDLGPPLPPAKIMYSMNALVPDETQRRFPASKHRSKRIHKKLCKRFHGEFIMKHVIFRTTQGFIAHPSFKSQFDQIPREKLDVTAWGDTT